MSTPVLLGRAESPSTADCRAVYRAEGGTPDMRLQAGKTRFKVGARVDWPGKQRISTNSTHLSARYALRPLVNAASPKACWMLLMTAPPEQRGFW